MTEQDVPMEAALAGGAASSSSLLESSLLELFASVFAFLADGPLAAALRFLASGDLNEFNTKKELYSKPATRTSL